MDPQYTKMGHRLIHVEGLTFDCVNEHGVGWDEKAKANTRCSPFVLSRIVLATPAQRGHVVTLLRAWLSAYSDPDLIEQVDEVVRKAIAGFAVVSPPSETQNMVH